MSELPEQHSIARKVLVGTGWLTGWRMASRLLGFASILLLTQILRPTDFGIVALASSVAMSIEAMSQIGVRDALVRLREDAAGYYDAAFTFQFFRGLITGCMIAVCGYMSIDWFGDARLQNIFWVLAGVALISGCENIGVVRLIRELDFRTQVLLQAVPRLAGFCLMVIAALATRSYWALVAGLAGSKIVAVILTYVTLPHWPRLRINGWRYLVHFSAWSWAGSICVLLWGRSDPFLLGPVLGSAALGVYVVSSEIATIPVSELIEPVGSALFSGFAMAHRTGKAADAQVLVVAGALALFGVPFSIGISACSGYLVAGLLGPRWVEAQPVIAAMAWLCMFSPFSYVCGSMLSAQGHVKRAFICNGMAAALKIGVTLLVRNSHDLRFIALANVGVVAAEATLFIWHVLAVGNTGLRQLSGTMLRAAGAAGVAAAVLWALPGTWDVSAHGRFPAIFFGGMIGTSAFPIFFLCQYALWRLAGRPEGAEEQLVIYFMKISAMAVGRARALSASRL